MHAMKEWYQEHPDLFHKRPYDRPGCDIYRSERRNEITELSPPLRTGTDPCP